MPFVRYKTVQMQIAKAYDEKKSGIPFIVKGRIPRFRTKTKDANFVVSIWLLNQDVMACRYLAGLFYSGTNVSRFMFDKSVMYAKSP